MKFRLASISFCACCTPLAAQAGLVALLQNNSCRYAPKTALEFRPTSNFSSAPDAVGSPRKPGSPLLQFQFAFIRG
jgi:hypothetical protein